MTARPAIQGTYSRALRCLASAAAVVAATSVAGPGTALADEAKPIHPGVMTRSEAGQCTSNFIFKAGDKVLIGQAAHCTGTGEATETDGCTSKSLPLGTEVKIDGASKPGKLVYNSWLAMHENGEKNKDTCAFNDFALVEIADEDEGKVTSTVPKFGGPTGLQDGPVGVGSMVYSYQNSSARGGIAALSPKTGTVLGEGGNGWSHEVVTLTPGVPGDSGSGFMTADGKAFGLLSTLNLLPAPGTNGVVDLNKAVSYANDNRDDLEPIHLVEGGPFHAGLL